MGRGGGGRRQISMGQRGTLLLAVLFQTKQQTRSSSREVTIRVPTLFCSLFFSRGTESPRKKRNGKKGT